MVAVLEQNVDFDYGSVRSRISWGAILAGAAVAMAIYALLMSLGVAIGLSVSDDVTTETLGNGAGIWGFIALLIALFIGGWVTTQVTTGESRTEAFLYGIVLWATTSVLLIWLSTSGMRAGVEAAMALQNVTGGNEATVTTDQSQSSEERQDAIARAREAGKKGSWWAFAGMLASMVAAIGGALVGPVELTVRRDTRHYRDPHTPVT